MSYHYCTPSDAQAKAKITVPNSDGKCLIENYVEEREVEIYDTMKNAPPGMYKGQYFRNGHKGILTTKSDEPISNKTLVRCTYVPPKPCTVLKKGIRQNLKERLLAKKILTNLTEQFDPPPYMPDYLTESAISFSKEGFVSEVPPYTHPHDLIEEQPVTFWTEHKDAVTGVSQVKTGDTPFRKNAKFSQPIDESWNEAEPYDFSNYPVM